MKGSETMSNEFDNIFSYKPGNAKSAEELYEKRITDDTIFDGIRSCRKCGRELSNDEFIWCSDCDADD